MIVPRELTLWIEETKDIIYGSDLSGNNARDPVSTQKTVFLVILFPLQRLKCGATILLLSWETHAGKIRS